MKGKERMKTIIIITVLLMTSGCAGEFYVGTRRIDTYEAHQVMKDKPYKCLFGNYDGCQSDEYANSRRNSRGS